MARLSADTIISFDLCPRSRFWKTSILALCASLLFAACASSGRNVVIYCAGENPVKGRLLAIRDSCVTVDTTDSATDFYLLGKQSGRSAEYRTATLSLLKTASASRRLHEIDSVYIEGENHVGTGMLVGLSVAGFFAFMGYTNTDEDGWFSDPWGNALIAAGVLGGPAFLLSTLIGILTSHGSEMLYPGLPTLQSDLEDASFFGDETPVELDSLFCGPK